MPKCAICNINLGFLDGKTKLKDGTYVCNACWKKGFNAWKDLSVNKQPIYTHTELKELIKERESKLAKITEFVVTSEICPSAKFNDDTREMILASHTFASISIDQQKKRPEYYTLFSYNQIVDYELLENGESIASGGIGRALVGGMLFGGAGAVVGAATRNYKSVCNDLKIKVTVSNYKDPAFYIPLINLETKKASSEYREKMKMAQDILSKFQLITSGAGNENKIKDTDSENRFEEIRKYKQLLDEGIISAEEFEKKKRELLDL